MPEYVEPVDNSEQPVHQEAESESAAPAAVQEEVEKEEAAAVEDSPIGLDQANQRPQPVRKWIGGVRSRSIRKQ